MVTFSLRGLFSSNAVSDGVQELPESIDVRTLDGVTFATFLKPMTVDETKRVMRYLGKEGIHHRRIWDLSKIEFPFTVDELRELAYFGRETLGTPGETNRIALVVKDSVGYGSLRAFSTYREGDETAQSRVFRSLDEAVRWVKDSD